MAEKITQFQIKNYQRNGSSGNGFYVATFNCNGHGLLATFETDASDLKVISESCRVIDRDDLLAKWRGDDFADMFNKIIPPLVAKGVEAYKKANNPQRFAIYDLNENAYQG